MTARTWAWRGYLIAVHLALAALVVKDDVADRLGVRAGLLADPDPQFTVRMRRQQARLDAAVPAGAVLFLGDSNMQSMPVSEVAPHAVNLGIAWQDTAQLLRSMDGYHSMQRAGAVVVMIGTNDFDPGPDAGLAQRFRAIVAKVPAAVPVVLASVPPMSGENVQVAVAAARNACEARPRCMFVDTFAALDGKPGMLLADGVHLTPAGYGVLIPLLRDALRRSHTSPSSQPPALRDPQSLSSLR